MNINHSDINTLLDSKPRASWVRGVLYLCIILFTHLTTVATTTAQKTQPTDTLLTASLITAWPGSEIYELCGHEAIRIQGPGVDSVWNFGIFNFNEPNFVYRFVKGETDYYVDGYPFEYFLPEYITRGSRVEEQVLNLTQSEVNILRKLLQQHTRPPLNRYRYNYIRNNCSTQIADLLDETAGERIAYPDSVRHSSFRDAMRHYHQNYPWYQFGIDIALGSGLDGEISQREELFVPVEFNRLASTAVLPDGRPLVKKTNILNEGSPTAVLGPTPWYATPSFVAFLVLLFTILMSVIDRRRRSVTKWWYSIYFGIEGLAGCLVFFLVFISVHAATSPNILIFWLNPLQLLVPICIWSRKTRILVKVMMWLNFCIVGLMIVLIPFYYSGQGQDWALVWLMITDFLMAANYIFSGTTSKRKGEPLYVKTSGRTKGNRTTAKYRKRKK